MYLYIVPSKSQHPPGAARVSLRVCPRSRPHGQRHGTYPYMHICTDIYVYTYISHLGIINIRQMLGTRIGENALDLLQPDSGIRRARLSVGQRRLSLS